MFWLLVNFFLKGKLSNEIKLYLIFFIIITFLYLLYFRSAADFSSFNAASSWTTYNAASSWTLCENNNIVLQGQTKIKSFILLLKEAFSMSLFYKNMFVQYFVGWKRKLKNLREILWKDFMVQQQHGFSDSTQRAVRDRFTKSAKSLLSALKLMFICQIST